MERRLTAILAADVVGYSRLMGLDEAGTLSALNAHRKELIDDCITEHRGRIVKLMGDGMLVEFPSVVNAVACSAAIQRGMAGRNESVPADRRIELRIGVNLGDVIVEGDDIFGDGVNVAARLEGMAEPGGIIVSSSVRDQVGERLALILRGSRRADAEEHRAAGSCLSGRTGRRANGNAPRRPGRTIGAAEQAIDRGLAVQQYERRSGTGVFRRRARRRSDHQPVEIPRPIRDRQEFDLRLQGADSGYPPSRQGTGRPLCPGGQRPEGCNPVAHHRTARRGDRCDACLGRQVRGRGRGHL